MNEPERSKEADEGGVNMERIVFFSDAVFAIAITLLALEIRVPELPDTSTTMEQLQIVLALWPHMLSFAISFVVIGAFWIGHHRMFTYFNRFDSGLIWTNFLLLMCIAFMPVPTSMLGNTGTDLVAVIFYALVLTLTALMSWRVWRYALSHHMVVDTIEPRDVALLTLRPLLTALICALSIPVAFLSPTLASLMWILTFFVRRAAEHVSQRHLATHT